MVLQVFTFENPSHKSELCFFMFYQSIFIEPQTEAEK